MAAKRDTMFLRAYKTNLAEIEKSTFSLSYVYDMWRNYLFERCIRLFEWKGLPENIPQKEIEIRLVADGFCGAVIDGKKGPMVATGGMHGPTQYFDEFTKFTYAAATARGGTRKIGKNCVIINNTSLRNSLLPLINFYASLMAHASISLRKANINLRDVDVFVADNDATVENIKDYQKARYEGKDSVIYDVDGELKVGDSVKNVANSRQTQTISEILNELNELKRMFFAEIGVRYAKEKKERMVEAEVSSDNSMLLINICDMLRQRQKAAEEMSKLYNCTITVDVVPELKYLFEEEDKDNPETETDESETTKESEGGENED